jgi:RNA polymerase sigma factor (sigma-70 family)
MPDDAELLRLYAEERSESAFTELVRRHLGLVYSAALRQLDGASHRAEDVTQSVFVDLARNAAALSRRSEIVGWLYTSTRFAALALKRREARREKRERDAHAMHEINAGTAENWEHIRPVLDQAMNELAESDRIAILMRFFENGRLADVGQRLGLSEDAARMRIDRALDRLRVRLQRRGISSTQTALAGMLTTQAVLAVPLPLFAKVASAATLGAAVTASSGILVPFWTSMTASKAIVGAAGLIAVLSLGTAAFKARKGAELQSTIAALEEERTLPASRDDDQARQQAASIPPGSSVATSTSGKDIVDTARAANTHKTATPDKAASERSLESTIDRLAMTNPALQELYVKQQTVRFPQRFGFLYAALGMTPGQIEEFERVMAQHAQAGIDIAVSALKQGLPKDDSAAGILMNRAYEERNQQLKAVLGDSGFEEFLWHEKNASWRSLADTLAQHLYYTDSPMSPDSALQLTKILSSNAARNAGKVNWSEVISDARQFLSPTQMRALENHWEVVRTGAQVAEILKASGVGPDSLGNSKP